MKFKHIFNLLLIAGLSLGMVSCSEKLGTDNSGEDTEDGPSFGGGTSSDGTSGQDVSLVSFLNDIASKQGANVPRAYAADMRDLAFMQLRNGGYRLAALLNRIFE